MSTISSYSGGGTEPREFNIRKFIVVSLLLHALLFLSFLLTFGGIFGGPGPGGGESVTFQLAAGSANDRYAAPPEPVVEPEPQPEPEPVKLPEPKPETVVRKEDKPLPPPEETPEPVQEAVKPAAPAGSGVQDGMAGGAGGDAAETILNKKGDSLTAGQIRSQMSGKTFHLEMGRLDLQGGNRLINTIIALDPGGTTKVELIQYFFQTYHRANSSTRSRRGTGQWWIEGNRWCHKSEEIQYNTTDCYDMTLEGNIVRLYYGPCTQQSSTLCKAGRLAAEGEIR